MNGAMGSCLSPLKFRCGKEQRERILVAGFGQNSFCYRCKAVRRHQADEARRVAENTWVDTGSGKAIGD